MLRQYLKTKNEEGNIIPVGLMLAVKHPTNGHIIIGFSYCGKKDTFSKKMANKIAVGRAIAYDQIRKPGRIYTPIMEELPRFINRCKAYFKTEKVSEWIQMVSDKNYFIAPKGEIIWGGPEETEKEYIKMIANN